MATAPRPATRQAVRRRNRTGPKASLPDDALDVRIGLLFRSAARMRHGPILGRADRLRVFPKVTRRKGQFAGAPGGAAALELLVRKLDVDRPLGGVDHDDVTVLAEADRPADRGL